VQNCTGKHSYVVYCIFLENVLLFFHPPFSRFLPPNHWERRRPPAGFRKDLSAVQRRADQRALPCPCFFNRLFSHNHGKTVRDGGAAFDFFFLNGNPKKKKKETRKKKKQIARLLFCFFVFFSERVHPAHSAEKVCVFTGHFLVFFLFVCLFVCLFFFFFFSPSHLFSARCASPMSTGCYRLQDKTTDYSGVEETYLGSVRFNGGSVRFLSTALLKL
jgi:hypothetical protein